MWDFPVEMAYDASGAVQAAGKGYIIVVVDVISMSTTIEAALEEGALAVFGASPDQARAPVFLNPEKIGNDAGIFARMKGVGLILVAEPRVGEEKERRAASSLALRGVKKVGVTDIRVLPNLGAETVKLASFKGKVVLAVTGSGGVAFDAGYNAGGKVLTATIARIGKMKGIAPTLAGAKRALFEARKKKTGICVVAASSNSLEDVLAARYIRDFIKVLKAQDFNHKFSR
ncbi:MAG: hypothetical protein PHT78_03200 [Desulfitobacteriaceae bacterium]|nr:hypothetical protein [Desulfitobacteriaceae bacterium]MDD4752248.1 hypothetical protein [Desulfitobacteriaceae bacterium]